MDLICFQDLGRKKRVKEEEVLGADFESWSSKRGDILARFTTTEKLSIVSLKSSKHGGAFRVSDACYGEAFGAKATCFVLFTESLYGH